jgi:hypothetical protein
MRPFVMRCYVMETEGVSPYVSVPFLRGLLLPVFEAHEVVEDGVDGRAEVVEETRDVEQVLVHPPKCLERVKKNPIC